MKKKIMAMCLVIAMAATAVIGGTLAYFTDTDEATNTMVVGKVDIELIEQMKDENGGLIDFNDDNIVLMPAVLTTNEETGKIHVENKVDKIVSVKNNNSNDAYVRVIYAFEGTNAEAQDYIHAFYNNNGWDTNAVYNVGTGFAGARMIGTNEYGNWTFVEAVYEAPLAANETTNTNLTGFFLSPDASNVDQPGNAPEVPDTFGEIFGTDYEIKVFVQAVQADGWAAAEGKTVARNALDTTFGNLHDGSEVTDLELAQLFFENVTIAEPVQP